MRLGLVYREFTKKMSPDSVLNAAGAENYNILEK